MVFVQEDMITQHWRLHTGADRQLCYYPIQKPWDLCLQNLMTRPWHPVYINRFPKYSFILSGVVSPLISSSILGTYWPGSSSFHVLSFCLFMLFSRKEYWSGLQFPSPVDHVLSDSTMTHQSWVALHGIIHSLIELDKAVVPVISFICFLWLWFSFGLPSER